VARIVLAAPLAALVLVGGARADSLRAVIESVAVDGSGTAKLADAPDTLESPAFSPDGRTVAFVHDYRTVELVGGRNGPARAPPRPRGAELRRRPGAGVVTRGQAAARARIRHRRRSSG
jgi:hypothetical protein